MAFKYGGPYLDIEILKLFKLRKIISQAWIPMGIGVDEAVDILLWAIGEDVKTLHISKWPERIMENTGVKFNSKEHTMLSIFRKVAQEWRRRKPLIIINPN